MKNCFIFLFIFLHLFFLFSIENSFAREKFKNQNILSSFDLNEIKNMEISLFNCSFENEDVDNRLKRLELKVFNIVGTGTTKDRFTALKSALNSSRNYSSYTYIRPYYEHNYNPYFYSNNYHRNKPYGNNVYRNKMRALRNLKSYLKGTMTGYTLPVQNYQYGLPNYDSNNNFFSNGGSSYEFQGRGISAYSNQINDGGIKIKILD